MSINHHSARWRVTNATGNRQQRAAARRPGASEPVAAPPDSQVVQDDRVTARGRRHRHPVDQDVAPTWLETEGRTLQHKESCLGDHRVTASLQRRWTGSRGVGGA